MKIVHRISIASNSVITRELAQFGIEVAESGLVSFDVEESSKFWPELKSWIARRRAVDVTSTKFSRAELADARWLELVPSWHYGFPQPDEDAFGYREATYDLSDWCDQCDIGMRQVAPFRIKSEPKWGKNGILQLHWILDEYFVTPCAWARIFKRHGIECRPVLSVEGVELRSVVQLVVREEVGVDVGGLPTETPACEKCGRTKYLPVVRGRFPALIREPDTAMVKTMEYFGSGRSAHKRVLVSQIVARSMTQEGLRGVRLRPAE